MEQAEMGRRGCDGKGRPEEMTPHPPRPLVAFDFDGTLTVRDTFLAFLAWRSGRAGWALGLARLLPDLLVHIAARDAERLKTAALRVFLRGAPLAEVEADAERFAALAFEGLMRPDALKAWEDWRGRGAALVIVTASPEPVIAPFARRLGAERLIGTRLAVDAQGRLTGGMDGRNCRGEEKVRRLREVYGPDLRLAAAYGDTDGDVPMLAVAEAAFMRTLTGRPPRT